jgi:hypothetical protein
MIGSVHRRPATWRTRKPLPNNLKQNGDAG